MLTQRYSKTKNVLTAARERVAWIFDCYDNIIVSISGGKDSTVIAHLALTEARRRERKIGLFFLDEEVVYLSTAEQVEYLMGLFPKNTNRLWLQVEFNLTNATSLTEGQLKAWEAGKHKIWMRSKGRNNIVARPWGPTPTIRNKDKGFGFYDVVDNFESCYLDTAFLLGVRATESPNRWRAMVKNPVDVAGQRFYWGTQRSRGNASLYPIYDWNFHDVWRYIHDEKLKYSKIYDFQFMKGMGIGEIRCSSLIHEKSFKSICDLPEFEPKTYEKLMKRIKGIGFAQETGKSALMFKARKLPRNFNSWLAYRDFLMTTYPDPDKLAIFRRRFGRQLNNEYVARQQCRQLVLNDYENNLSVRNESDPREQLIEYYRSVL
ncbi:MAG: phosphoadenosine phosphosulfate reductase family protein [Desulfobulbales bacterium]|nr:phosphoadenosine phosphosulfate reductase family protein [Desulfobulbales bacterium]